MEFKFSPKWSLLVLVFTTILFSSFLYLSAHSSNSKIISIAEQESFGFPARLKIPKLNVDANIEKVGLTPDGAMDVPTGPENAAWLDIGPFPGEVGSSVIDGHSGYKNNRPAIFDNLHKLSKGDVIYVEDKNGVTDTFIVREARSYRSNENPAEVFISSDGLSHLNLITCSGIWNKADKTHSDRLVVFADKIE